ncbi:MAG TPA: DNA polymerase, partial [Hyphomicrobiaceae bacterium]|nr:DNA polymerase [Hyphomicrobiaceae bacterium]
AALNLIADKRKQFRPQNYLWQLPARYVGPYAVGDAINTFLVREHFDPILDQENTRAAYRLECDLLPLIVEMRLRGIRIDILAAERARDLLLGKRDAALAQLSDKLAMPVSMDELNRAKWKGEVFDRERVAYPKTEKGNPSFSGDWMEGHAHWLPQLICEAEKQHRAGDKFIGKYILEHTVNGRIHAEIHPFQTEDHGAKSYRFSYSDPPLQQMSARDEEFASIIRGLFLPEEGEVWAKPDASQQEFRIAVHYAAIHNMTKAEIAVQRYCDDPATDFHSLTAQITGLDRKDAKAVNFAKMYGAGVGKFAEMIGKPINEARAIYAQYDRELPFLRALSKAYEYLARHQGYITLYDGARRHFNLWAPGGKWEKRAAPCEREEAERRLDDPNHKWFGKGQLYRTDTHNALNALIQGTAARHTALWMRAVWREGIVPLLQMHDCLDCSVATREQAEMVAQLCVEAVQLKVPMRVDLKFGRTWGDAKHTWEGVQSTTEPAGFVSASIPIAELNELPATSMLVPELEPTPASTAVQSNGAHTGDGARVQDHQSEILTEPVENTMGAYAQCAEVLVERGYATIPIMAGSKAPGFYCAGLWVPLLGWQRRYLHGRTPNYMDHNLWGSGNAGIGVVGGKASHGLVAIDIDTDDPAIKVAIVKVLPPTPVRKIGAKGETAFYFGPDIMTSRSWNIDGKRVCDLIADGRQTVLPPTIHPDTGCPYRWLTPSIPTSCRFFPPKRSATSTPCSCRWAGNPSRFGPNRAMVAQTSTRMPTRRIASLTTSRWRISSAGYRSSASTNAARLAAGTRRWHTGDRRRAVASSRCGRGISASCPKASRTSAMAAAAATALPTPRSTW